MRAPATALLTALLLAASGRDAAAQLGRKSWEFFPHVGVFLPGQPEFLPDELQELDPGVLWGIYATYHYSDHVGVELGFSKGTANGPEEEMPFTVGDVGFDFWELNGFVNSGALNRVQFFATAGGGLVNLDPEDGGGPTRLLLDGGVGVRYYAWKNIAIRGEVKDFFFPKVRQANYVGADPGSPGPEDEVHNIGVFAGITFNF